jgi:predicted ferric reductase
MEKLPVTKTDLDKPRMLRTSISFVIQARTGMTRKLFDRVSRAPNGLMNLTGAVEGPYGGHESLHSYGTVVAFAGGIGITHQVSHVRDLVSGHAERTVATKKVVLVWIVRDMDSLEWVRPWMDKVLQTPKRRDILKVLIFVTRPKNAREVISPSATVQMFPGRPNPQVILDKEIIESTGAIAVTVCGPGSLADSVRHATRKRVGVKNVDFIEESFTW